MSTLPALIDELRKCEREWDGSNMFELARMCRDAADMLDENERLRELVRDMWQEGMCECGSRGKCESCMYDYPTRMRELGVDA